MTDQNTRPTPSADELKDVINEALQDSMDVDWSTSVGAEHVARALTEAGFLTRPTPPSDVETLPKGVVDYVLQYGGRCRDCADENGVCPSSGLPCGGSRIAVEHVVEAINYGLANGYLLALSALPAQVEVTDEAVRLGGDILMQHGLNAPEQEIYAAFRAALTATDAKPLDDSSSCTKIWSIGNELHNIAIEHQTNEELAARLDKLACRLWESRPATDAKPVVPAELVAGWRLLNDVRMFIEREYADPSAAPNGEWLAKEARLIHDRICRALANFHSAPPLASEGKTDA